MLNILKKNFLVFFLFTGSLYILSDEDPYIFIDENAQKMVRVLTEDSSLFKTDRALYENKIKEIFEPMIDFRRVSASVMGKKYYLLATKEERAEFVLIFRDSLLDTYAETLAQWGDSTITTEFPKNKEELSKNVEKTISEISPKKKIHSIDDDEKSVGSHYKLYNEILK